MMKQSTERNCVEISRISKFVERAELKMKQQISQKSHLYGFNFMTGQPISPEDKLECTTGLMMPNDARSDYLLSDEVRNVQKCI